MADSGARTGLRRLLLFMSRPTVGFAISFSLVVIVTALTLTPTQNLPPAPGSDKLHHFIGFAALALPAAFARPRWVLWIIALVTAYGALIEIIQPHVGRHGEIMDAVANAAGACFGGVLGAVLRGLLVPVADQD